MDIESLIEEELNDIALPVKPQSFDKLNHLSKAIIMGLPVCPYEKIEKLTAVVIKTFNNRNIKIDNLIFPKSESNETKGFAFATFLTESQAKDAVNLFNGYPFDKKHVLSVIPLNENDSLINMDTEYNEPESTTFKFKEDMKSFLLQPQCRDQMLINHREKNITIFENMNMKLDVILTKELFGNSRTYWSPCGSYLAILHDKGAGLFGGPKFEVINRFSHNRVEHIIFSPDEKYIITHSCNNSTFKVLIWDILSETLIREFLISRAEEDVTNAWPIFKFSFDGKYFARIQKDKISVYESESCVMLEKKSIDIKHVRDFSWSSKGHLLSYWVAEVEPTPARVVLIEIPSKKELFAKTLFNVLKLSLKWSSDDAFLAVGGERYTKKKYENAMSSSLEIYNVKEKEIPVEKVAVEGLMADMKWEPTGSKFAYLVKNMLCMRDAATGQTVKSLDLGIKMDSLSWSPSGHVLVSSLSDNNQMAFIDCSDCSLLNKVDNCKGEMSWDPTGRYVSVATLSLSSATSDTSVTLYNTFGKPMYETNFKGLTQAMWRPRPATLLPEKDLKAIKRNMAKYNKKFAHEDATMSNEYKRALYEKRQALVSEWATIKGALRAMHQQQNDERTAKRRMVDSDEIKTMEGSYILIGSKTVKVI